MRLPTIIPPLRGLLGALAFSLAVGLPSVSVSPVRAEPPSVRHEAVHVVDADGKPVPFAVVHMEFVDADTQKSLFQHSYTTDATGYCDIAISSNVAKGFDWQTVEYVQYAVSPKGDHFGIVSYIKGGFTLQPLADVRVRFVDEDAQPIARLKVSLRSLFTKEGSCACPPSLFPQWTTTTDRDGIALFKGLPKGASLRAGVVSDVYASPENAFSDSSKPSAIVDDKAVQTVRLARGVPLNGHIDLGATGGQPAADVRVCVVAKAKQDIQFLKYTRTDAHGDYHVGALPPGTYRVGVRLTPAQTAQWTGESIKTVTVANTVDALSPVDLKLVSGAVLSGVLTDEKGAPLADALFAVDVADAKNFRDLLYPAQGVTDGKGRYSVHVPANVDLRFIPDDDRNAHPVKALALGATGSLDIAVRRRPHPVSVAGVVVDDQGLPVSGAEIESPDNHFNTGRKVVTDSKGRFEFLMASGAHVIAKKGADLTTKPVEFTGAQPIKVTIQRNVLVGVLTGRVQDAAGKSIAGALVDAFHYSTPNGGGIGVGTATTARDGSYTIKGLDPHGKYSVGANAKGYGDVSGNADLYFGKRKAIVAPAITLPKADTFAGGVVVDVQGKPLAGAILERYFPATTLTTDAKGAFYFTDMVRGDNFVMIGDPRGDTRTRKGIVVKGGQANNVVKLLTDEEEKQNQKRFADLFNAGAKENHGDGTDAVKLLQAALARAGSSNRSVFLTFHASWCGPCFALHHFLIEPEVKPIIDKYFVVQDIDIWEEKEHLTWNNPGGEDLYKKYDKGKMDGVPFWVVLQPDGKVCGTGARPGASNMGNPSEPPDIAWFLKTLKAAAPGMTDAEIATLKAQLAKGI